jgi:glyoxylase-like metal-dependent hydrolase (beta-lactamase superfamily II)
LETDLADGTGKLEEEAGAAVSARGLSYPLGQPPAPGEAIEAAPGVLWMRLPLPMALDHVNLYAVRDGEGWVVVDTGLDTSVSREGWEAALAGPLGGLPVTRVICTHMHPDHLGLAGWLCDRFQAPLLMSRLEYVTGRMLIADTGRPAPKEGVDFFHGAGWTSEQLDRYRAEFGRFGRAVSPLPQSYTRLSEGDVLTIGGDEWAVVVGSGHSPEHVCLWRKSDDVFLAGDQILPRISSNVSVWPTEPLQDPLDDWMRSIDRLEALLPEETFILPAHGEPFFGVGERLRALRRGHEVSLKRLERRLAEPRRAIDVFQSLFARPIGDGVLGMATGEAIAHLNYLAGQGRARRDTDANGVVWWSATGSAGSVENTEETT